MVPVMAVTKDMFGASEGESRDEAVREPLEAGAPRFQRAVRDQQQMTIQSLDMLIAPDHTVRMVWSAAQQLDLSAFYGSIKAVEGRPGRPPIDPRILFALWVYATLEGVASARHLADLCEESAPYQWLCGGVGVNHHALSDFTTGHPDRIRALLLQHRRAPRGTRTGQL